MKISKTTLIYLYAIALFAMTFLLAKSIITSFKTNDYDYGFLELSGSGTKTLGGVVDVYNDLTINGGNLLVNNGEILRVRDEFKNISGTATFENNASLIQVNNVSNSGNITYKRTPTCWHCYFVLDT